MQVQIRPTHPQKSPTSTDLCRSQRLVVGRHTNRIQAGFEGLFTVCRLNPTNLMGAMVFNTKYLFEIAPKKSAVFFKSLILGRSFWPKFRSTFFIKENTLKRAFYLRKV